MKPVNSILLNIVSRTNNSCCLCFKAVTKDVCRLRDKVILEPIDDNYDLEIFEILASLLGDKFINSLSVIDAVCNECTKMALCSYKFIKSCEANAAILDSVFGNLYNCFSNAPDEIAISNKSLFIHFDENDHRTTSFCDNKRPVLKRKAALVRFRTLSKVKYEVKKEVMIKNEDESELNNDCDSFTKELECEYKETPALRTKTKTRKNTLKIPKADMVFDINEKKLNCKVCLRSFPSLYNLRQHFIRIHHPKTIKCPHCPKFFASKSIVAAHIYDCHCTVICSECGKVYHNRHAMKEHEKGHCSGGIVCQACGKCYKNRCTFKNHIQSGVCGQKERQFKGTFTCDICSKRYSYKSALRVHINFEHGNGKAYVCMWCNKRFSAQSKLKVHILKHTQEKNFTCELCGGKFVTKASLLYHTRTHTGEKPYKCESCERCFVSASLRIEHIRRHHMVPQLECDLCHVKFKARASLRKHRKRHFNPGSRLHHIRNESEEQ